MGQHNFRTRPCKDDDIEKCLNSRPDWQDEADVVRAALRLYFGLQGVDKPMVTNYEPVPYPAAETPLDANNKLDDLLGGL